MVVSGLEAKLRVVKAAIDVVGNAATPTFPAATLFDILAEDKTEVEAVGAAAAEAAEKAGCEG